MKRELSSKLTILPKLLAVFFICAMSIMTLVMFLELDRSDQPAPKFIFLFLTFGSMIIFYFTIFKYKRVWIDESFMYVSNHLKEIKIPLSHISDVTEIAYIRGHPITIHLTTPSEFGKKITFTPKANGFRFFSANPLVNELKGLAGMKTDQSGQNKQATL